MASFTEQATLLLNDKSSANIKKVNAELNKLFKTAQKLNNMRINLRGLSQVGQQARAATTALNNMSRSASNLRRPVAMRVTANTQAANAAVNSLRRNAQRSVRMNITGGGGAGGVGGVIGGGRGPGRVPAGPIGSFNNGLLQATRQLLLFQIATNTTMATITEAGQAVMEAEDARTRIRQAGFTGGQATGFEDMTRDIQKNFNQVPAANILDASVELLATLKANGASAAEMESAMARVASNAQIMGITFKDIAVGAESARQLEKIGEIFNLSGAGQAGQIKALQEQVMRAVIAEGSDLSVEEAVRVARQLGSSITLGLDDEAFADILAVRDSGGARSTAEVRTAVRDLTRTSLEKKLKKQQRDVGLRGDDLVLKEEYNRQLAANPVDFAFNVLKPIVQSLGGDLEDVSDVARVLTTQMGFSTTGAQFFADALTSQAQIIKDRTTREAVDLNAALNENTIRGSFNRLVAAFDTMVAIITEAVNGPLAEAMNGFAGFLTEFGDIFKDAPLVTADDIAKRREDALAKNIPLPTAAQRLPQELFGALTPDQAKDGVRKLQESIGAQVDGIIGPETTSKFNDGVDRLVKGFPSLQRWQDMWAAAAENAKAENKTFTDKLGLAFDFLITKVKALPWDDINAALAASIGKIDFGNLASIAWKSLMGFDKTDTGQGLGDLNAQGQKMIGDFILAQLDDMRKSLFGETTKEVGRKGEERLVPTQFGEFMADMANAKAKAIEAWANIVNATNYVATQMTAAADAVGKFINSLLNWDASKNVPELNEPATVPQGTSFWDWFKAGMGMTVPLAPGEPIIPIPLPVQPTSDGGAGFFTPNWIETIKGWFSGEVPAGDKVGALDPAALSGAVTTALSPAVQASIDGISQGGAQAATSVQDGFTSGGSSAGATMQAAITAGGQAAANLMLAAIQNAAATINVNVAGGGGYKPDTGPVGAPALA